MEICIRSLKTYIRSLKGQYGSSCITSWSDFAGNIEKIQQRVIYMCFFINVGQIFLKGQLIQIFQKILETEIKHKLLMKINKESLRGQYG